VNDATEHNETAAWLVDALLNSQATLGMSLFESKPAPTDSCKDPVNEDRWLDVFRKWLPQRYGIAPGWVIDSFGGRSELLKLIIFDAMATPAVHQKPLQRLIPIETTLAVFSPSLSMEEGDIARAARQAASVRGLRRAVMGPPSAAVYATTVIAGILALRSDGDLTSADDLAPRLPRLESERLDCGLALRQGAFDAFDRNLRIMNHAGALTYFLFRLLNKLQSCACPYAVNWQAYAETLDARRVAVGDVGRAHIPQGGYSTPC